MRICGDYKITVNRVAKVDNYPLPRIEDLFASLTGGKHFSKLDLAHAYQQIPLHEDSKQYVVINTHKGLYQYNRLPFGVASAPAIFQKTMEGVLQGIDHVTVYLDDILVTGKNEEEHLHNLEKVLIRLQQAGMRLKKKKCAFMLPCVEYLGHTISAHGLQSTSEKVKAIKEAPVPTNVQQLRSFLGLINYYSKFLPALSSTLAPLYQLLQKSQKWVWEKKQTQAFQKAKDALTSNQILAHYDPEQPVVLECDASPYGLGAVLSHQYPDDQTRPIAFASRSLTVAEKKYSQLDKEGLAIIFGIKRFHQYLAGRTFTIHTDHRPLQHILAEDKPVPTLASARIQRWALTLSAYNYTISYKPGSQLGNADLLSRLPLRESSKEERLPGEYIQLLDNLQTSPLSATHIKNLTNRDPVLSQIAHMLLNGWADTSDPSLHPYQRRKEELSLHDGVVLWGNRVVIPEAARQRVLGELHEGHPGISRIKGISRGMVWWPGINQDIERQVKSCHQCQVNQKAPSRAPLHPWEWPEKPWSRVHLDYAGPWMGKMFLIAVDAHSKWLEVEIVPAATSTHTITKLRAMLATHGLPEIIVTDNGTVFTSSEFKEFLKKNGIRHLTSPPYHPSSNGLAERYVQTFKRALKKQHVEDIQCQLSQFLFRYRTTPQATTGISPCEMLMGRHLRTHLDNLRPNLSTRIQTRQAHQKQDHDGTSHERSFDVGDKVFVHNFTGSLK